MSEIILVNEFDQQTGVADKWDAHKQGLCHRAFSVFIFREKKGCLQTLLQQRASDKYHSQNLWSNACCSHPKPNQNIEQAAKLRLKEEIGMQTPLLLVDKFHYCQPVGNELIENEWDYLFIGYNEQTPCQLNPSEVQAVQWMDADKLETSLKENPKYYSIWLQPAWQHVKPYIKNTLEKMRS
jgi:isopentenyl-diphosphate delta-isomerase type 1